MHFTCVFVLVLVLILNYGIGQLKTETPPLTYRRGSVRTIIIVIFPDVQRC